MLISRSWRDQYNARKSKNYHGEVTRYSFEPESQARYISMLFVGRSFTLEPPKTLAYLELRDILKQSRLKVPMDSSPSIAPVRDRVYIDDRRSVLDEAVAGQQLESKDVWMGLIGKHEVCDVDAFYDYVTATEVGRNAA